MMNEAQLKAQVLMMKGVVSELPDEDRAKMNNCEAELREIINRYGDIGLLAVSFIGAELALRAEQEKW